MMEIGQPYSQLLNKLEHFNSLSSEDRRLIADLPLTVMNFSADSMLEAGCTMTAQNTSGQSRCFCGATIDLKNTAQHVYAAHMTGRVSA